jgi:N-acetyl-anhydromuramyl-L-alanine amidase AmpD
VVHSISLPPGEYGGDDVQRLFTNTAGLGRAPLLPGHRGLQVSAHFFVRRDGALVAVRELRRPGLACRGIALPRPRQLQRRFHRHRARRPGRKHFEPAQYETLAGLCRRAAPGLSDRHIAGHEHIAPGRKQDPGRASTGLCCRAPLAHYQIIRRNGGVVPFEPNKIAVAMMKAFLAVHGTQGAASASVRETVDGLTQAVIRALMRSRPGGGTFHIEDVQDQVELGLMRGGHHEIARAYVLYRERRTQERAQAAAKPGAGSAADPRARPRQARRRWTSAT